MVMVHSYVSLPEAMNDGDHFSTGISALPSGKRLTKNDGTSALLMGKPTIICFFNGHFQVCKVLVITGD